MNAYFSEGMKLWVSSEMMYTDVYFEQYTEALVMFNLSLLFYCFQILHQNTENLN